MEAGLRPFWHFKESSKKVERTEPTVEVGMR